jgi:archaellin
MRRGGSGVLLAVVAVAGLAAGILVPGGGASSKASHATSHSMATGSSSRLDCGSRHSIQHRRMQC